MELIKLIGVVVIVLGFTLKFDVLATVLVAALTTGLVAGLSVMEIIRILGESFVNNRLMSVFLMIFPVIAIMERYGLKERSATLIGKIKKASAGKVLALYMIIRSCASALNIRIGGHVEFIRPLILPMAEAAARQDKGEPLDEKQKDVLKGMSAAVENYGNFFIQNVFPASSGVLLIQGALAEAGYMEVTLSSVASASIPVAVIVMLLTFLQIWLFNRQMKRKGGSVS